MSTKVFADKFGGVDRRMDNVITIGFPALSRGARIIRVERVFIHEKLSLNS